MSSDGIKRRGFGSMSPERRQELSRKGGLAARDKQVAHRWDSDEARKAGKQARRKKKR